MAGSEKHLGFKVLYGDESNKTFGIAVGNSSRALHIFEAADAGTDWNVAADTHPTLYIHSATTPATDYIKMYHDATIGYLDIVGGTTLRLLIAGTAEIDLTASAFSPAVTDSNALGTTALMWSDLFLASGAVINFNNGDITITHAANLLTMAGGAMNFGVDDTGIDVKFFGATASAYMEWDESADRLNIVTVSGRAITGEEHAFDIVNGGTLSSGDSMVGCNVVTTASGTAGSWVSAGYFKTVQASKVVNGYLCGLEVELQSTAANASDNAVLVLNTTRNHTGSPPACDPYILLREYGTTYGNVFLRIFGDTGQGAITGGASSTLLVTNTADKAATTFIRCMFGSTVFWLMGTTNAPS